MTGSEELIRSIADTARWVAYHRASETARPDALFQDPYALRLAGDRGAMIGHRLDATGYVALRTRMFDDAILDCVARDGCDMAINLAAGLDVRPQRLPLPATLRWVEIDLPEIMALKERELADAPANCLLERCAADLAQQGVRRQLFTRLGSEARHALAISEGLLIYLTADEVATLATDLHTQRNVRTWIVEVQSPNAIADMKRDWGDDLATGHSALHFAPRDWRRFYAALGWKPVRFRDMHQVAVKYGRVPRKPGILPAARRVVSALSRRVMGDLARSGSRSGVAVLARA